jgi:hypothetical protein
MDGIPGGGLIGVVMVGGNLHREEPGIVNAVDVQVLDKSGVIAVEPGGVLVIGYEADWFFRDDSPMKTISYDLKRLRAFKCRVHGLAGSPRAQPGAHGKNAAGGIHARGLPGCCKKARQPSFFDASFWVRCNYRILTPPKSHLSKGAIVNLKRVFRGVRNQQSGMPLRRHQWRRRNPVVNLHGRLRRPLFFPLLRALNLAGRLLPPDPPEREFLFLNLKGFSDARAASGWRAI